VDNKSHMHQGCHTRSTSAIPKNLASLANEYRRLAVDCVRVLRLEMQLETIYHMQVNITQVSERNILLVLMDLSMSILSYKQI
jgi:hypothetical protein